MNELRIPRINSAVIPDLNVFLVVLSHMPLEAQMDILRQASEQITIVLGGTPYAPKDPLTKRQWGSRVVNVP